MQKISYISAIATTSIICSLIYVIVTDINEIKDGHIDKTYSLIDIFGIPSFFGIALFMFEGNPLALEIYH
jgi:hypothetical protein